MSGGDQNWQVGDLALCIYGGPWGSVITGRRRDADCPQKGSVNTVRELSVCPKGNLCLHFVDYPRDIAFDATAFRKIEPHAPDEEDAETIRLLNSKPVTPVPPKTPELV
jgi:hypothetical protein